MVSRDRIILIRIMFQQIKIINSLIKLLKNVTTQEAEARVQGQHRQKISNTLSQK
jgi:hypothetical protein